MAARARRRSAAEPSEWSLQRAQSSRRARFKIKSRAKESATCAQRAERAIIHRLSPFGVAQGGRVCEPPSPCFSTSLSRERASAPGARGRGQYPQTIADLHLIARCAPLPRSASLKAGSVEGSTRSDFLASERDNGAR